MIEAMLAASGVPTLASPLVFAGLFAVVLVAAMMQGAVGMGFGLTAAPILALVDTALVPGPMLILGTVTATLAVVVDDGRVRWAEVGLCTAGRLFGVAAAMALLAMLAEDASFNFVFGLMIVAAVGLSFAGWRLPFTRGNLVAMGGASGLMGTITSVGAPPLAMIYQQRTALDARSTLSAYFAIGCLVSFAGAALTGWAGGRDVVIAALFLPAALGGIAVSRLVRRHIDQRFRLALLAISFGAGVLLMVKGLL